MAFLLDSWILYLVKIYLEKNVKNFTLVISKINNSIL